MAAMKSGAGAVILAVPQSIHPILARRMTGVIVTPQPETSGGSLANGALPALLERAAWADVIAIGPGLSRDPETMALVRAFVKTVVKPLVIDADALIALDGNSRLVKKRKGGTILTPHTGEFGAMTGVKPADAESRRIEVTRTAARTWKCTVVLKGAPTVTADEHGVSYVNSTGNPGMATMGSGDVLTGLIAGLHAQGMQQVGAAFSGVFLHGLAGDVAAERFGKRSTLANDILDSIVPAFARVNS
jgi:ADP-dependent NAD(P)H-hydrate dehydratase / NAD(P)H-hydrate epimerase